MIPFTKELLINLLFLFVLCFAGNITFEHLDHKPTLKKWVHCLLGCIGIMVCILFGVHLDEHIIFDLRQIPFILVGLAEGPLVVGILLVVTILTRLLLDGNGSIATIIVYSLLGVLVIRFRPMYLASCFTKRLKISLSLSILCSTIMLSSLYILGSALWNSTEIWLTYLIIPPFGLMLLMIFYEKMHRFYQLKREIYKAEKIQMISNLAASFGHEVRNPITVTKGFLQLLLEDDFRMEKRKDFMKTALLELERAEKIIQNYLSFAKPKLEHTEPFNLQNEMKQTLDIIHPLANLNNVTVKFTCESNDYWINGAKNEFHQSLLNIFKNAIEAMPTGGILSIQISLNENHIEIEISDTGIGMSSIQIQRLGEPYFTSKENGTGLGTMIAFNMIKAMGGAIQVQSQLTKGTTFKIRFPKWILSSKDKKEHAS